MAQRSKPPRYEIKPQGNTRVPLFCCPPLPDLTKKAHISTDAATRLFPKNPFKVPVNDRFLTVSVGSGPFPVSRLQLPLKTITGRSPVPFWLFVPNVPRESAFDRKRSDLVSVMNVLTTTPLDIIQ